LVLSLLIVGLGQFYNGEHKKGALMLGAAIVLGFFSFGLLWFAVAIWSAVDAYRVARGRGNLWR
jgi:TM2 domain-containing membrane protein YozV